MPEPEWGFDSVWRIPEQSKRSDFDDVGLFHEKFGLDNVTVHGPGPRGIAPEFLEMRFKFLKEEFEEFYAGMCDGDDAQMFDALLDLVYVAMGTAQVLGYPWEQGWAAVQAANMAKLRSTGDDDPLSKRASKYDVVKPPGWTPPDIEAVLGEAGFERCVGCGELVNGRPSIHGPGACV